MPSEYCYILLDEPDRFVRYFLADSRVRNKVYDKGSFARLFNQVLKSDPELTFLSTKLEELGESLEICGENIYNNKNIQELIKKNNQQLRQRIRTKVKKDRPELKGVALQKEIDRRIKIAIGVTGHRPLKQVNITQVLKPITVKYYHPRFKKYIKYSKSKPQPLTEPEKNMIRAYRKKGKSVSEFIQAYYAQNLGSRTETSLRKHYYRLK